jgi:hypothetical protein
MAQAVGAAVDKVVSTPSAINYILAQGVDHLRTNNVEENLLQQVRQNLARQWPSHCLIQ